MESSPQKRGASPRDERTASALGQDRPQHCRRPVERLLPGNQVGPRKCEPGLEQRTAEAEEAQGDRAHRGAEGYVDRGGDRSLVHRIVPRNGGGPRCPPWRSTCATVVGYRGWS